MWTKAFWKSAVERMVRMTAGVLLSIITADTFNAIEVDYQKIMISILTGMITSLLISLVASQVSSAEGSTAGATTFLADRPNDPENR